MNKVIQGVRHKDAYTRLLQREIVAWMNEAIFDPLRNLLKNSDALTDRHNEAQSAVAAALNRGEILYVNGEFTGKFSAATSRELKKMGAEWSPSSKSFRLPIERVPYDIRGAMATSKAINTATHEEVLRTLATIEANVATADLGLQIGKVLDTVLKDLGKQYVRTVSAIDTVAVKAEIDAGQRVILDRELTQNLNLGIKKFATEQIPELRALVEKNLIEGLGEKRLAAVIESRFGVSQRKAEFLAGNETSLLTAKYARIQAEEVGCKEYIWSTSGDVRVREDHQHLDGKRFSFSSPPITNRVTGARNNPGEDYNCRCVAMPILVFPA